MFLQAFTSFYSLHFSDRKLAWRWNLSFACARLSRGNRTPTDGSVRHSADFRVPLKTAVLLLQLSKCVPSAHLDRQGTGCTDTATQTVFLNEERNCHSAICGVVRQPVFAREKTATAEGLAQETGVNLVETQGILKGLTSKPHDILVRRATKVVHEASPQVSLQYKLTHRPRSSAKLCATVLTEASHDV